MLPAFNDAELILHPDPSTIKNKILCSLPQDVLESLLSQMQPAELLYRSVLHPAGEPIAAVHFMETGYVSMLAVLADGDVSEVGLVGSEGMTGLPLMLGTDRSPLEAMVQSPGVGLRMEAGAFRRAMDEVAPLRDRLLRYAMAFQVQVAMTAACNSRHPIEQRLSRWLLMAHDRTEGDTFPMTHELLSMMLGVRRAGVTVAAGGLQRAGFIAYEAGRITVTDRQGLEASACECHGAVGDEFARLFGRGCREG